jgi:hypothetical protein
VVRVCAWCQLFLGLKRPLDRWELTHGVCRSCESRLMTVVCAPPTGASARTLPAGTLIVSRDPIGLEAAGELIARAGHTMHVVADRRQSDRRGKQGLVLFNRRRADRRASPPASWTRGYVLIEPSVDPEIANLPSL